MTESNDNTRYNVPHPEMWSLALRLGDDSIDFTMLNGEGSLMAGSVALGDGDGYAKRLEAAVYDNPFLLQQFGSTTIVAQSDRFLLLPDEMTLGDEAECQRYYNSIYDDDRNVIVNPIKEAGMSVAFSMERSVESFVQRTFFNPPMQHCLSPLITWFKRTDASVGRNRMYVALCGAKMSIVVLKSGRVAFANIFPADSADNAYYYIVNAWQHCDLSQTDDALLTAGICPVKEALLPRLHKIVANIAPVAYPSELLRLGEDVMQAPFDLTILPLCE